jgi:hypothetical protein
MQSISTREGSGEAHRNDPDGYADASPGHVPLPVLVLLKGLRANLGFVVETDRDLRLCPKWATDPRSESFCAPAAGLLF